MPWIEAPQFRSINGPLFTSFDSFAPAGDFGQQLRLPTTAAAWPAANRAIYCQVVIEFPVTVKQLAISVAASAGNIDLGLLNEAGTLLTSKGSTLMAGTNTLQVLDVADYACVPGVYFLAAVCSTITTATFNRTTANVNALVAAGVQQEALGATTIITATFADPASSFYPLIVAGGTVL